MHFEMGMDCDSGNLVFHSSTVEFDNGVQMIRSGVMDFISKSL